MLVAVLGPALVTKSVKVTVDPTFGVVLLTCLSSDTSIMLVLVNVQVISSPASRSISAVLVASVRVEPLSVSPVQFSPVSVQPVTAPSVSVYVPGAMLEYVRVFDNVPSLSSSRLKVSAPVKLKSWASFGTATLIIVSAPNRTGVVIVLLVAT